ncbi:archaetidylserine decarboxylase [Glaciecola petra]|uniref:phosphatidylserine decarboxylase n=1 Tax=Glaciecola petra TaxID=3075602 RepID=A0ABU2ZT21_9ALTE|nr:archaetidylserine decarboxylase [Aestuariibacter sp. P117]MDT0595178.1 archaetidylserine decarboxylase [Aestuariibacter sp. P117]
MNKTTTLNKPVEQLTFSEQLNFILTNRIPRQFLTRFVGFISQIENRYLASMLIYLWKQFAPDLNFDEAKENKFTSLRACFIRELVDGARECDPDPDIVTSPCDAIIGEFGKVKNGQLFQAKGFPYLLKDLIPEQLESQKFRDGVYITLRLKSSMYHRFHAPTDAKVNKLSYISGDTWNVNPIALKKIPGLFCLNERAVVPLQLTPGRGSITLVPIAAILVASMKFNCLSQALDMRHKGPNEFSCNHHYKKGDEMGYFQHGSTIIIFASKEYQFTSQVKSGARINMGVPLFMFDNNLSKMESLS